MSRRPEQLVLVPAAELEALRREWLGGGGRQHFGVCASCGRVREPDGRSLWVIRPARSRRGFECFPCHVARVRRPRRRRAA